MPAEAAGTGDVAADGDRLFKCVTDGADHEQVAVGDRGSEAGGCQREHPWFPLGVVDNLLEADAGCRGDGVGAPGEAEQRGQRFSRLHLVDGRHLDLSAERYLGTDGWDEDDVAGQQVDVLRLVAVDKQIVEVEGGERLVLTPQFDGAHGADLGRTAGSEDRIDQRA